MKVKSENEVTQSCLTLSNAMDCSLPGSSVHGIFQARVLEWAASAFSGIYPEETKIERETCILLFIAALFTIARTWKQPTCPSTDKEVVVYIHNGILISHKMEHMSQF